MGETIDPAIATIRRLFDNSKLTLDELGQRMGYAPPTARKSAWQFLNKTTDPRLSMLRKFALAVGVPLAELLTEAKKVKSKGVEGSNSDKSKEA